MAPATVVDGAGGAKYLRSLSPEDLVDEAIAAPWPVEPHGPASEPLG